MTKQVEQTVIFGTEAVRYAADYGVKKTIKKIDSGKIEGSYSTYTLDTENDLSVLHQALEDASGWGDYYYE